MKNRKPKASPPNAPGPGTDSSRDQVIADLRFQIIEIRELVVQLLQHHGYEDAGMRGGRISIDSEKRITLQEAATFIWSKSVAKNPESLRMHAEILRGWATKGLGGRVLEATVRRNRWYTSREAVERFERQLWR